MMASPGWMPAARPGVSVATVFVGIFIVLVVVFMAQPYVNYVVKGFGGVLAGVYILYALRDRLRPSPEMILYLVWVGWSLAAIFAAPSAQLFWLKWSTIFQIWILLVIMSGLINSQQALSHSLGWFLAAALIVGGYSYVTGDYKRVLVEGERVSGLALGANGFGWTMLLATVAAAYFWMLPSRARKIKRLMLLALMVGMAAATVLSGSRKAILGLGAFYLLWPLFCYRKDMWRRPALLALVMVGLTVGGVMMVRFVYRTPVADRFREGWMTLTGSRASLQGGTGSRLRLYSEARDLIVKHPIVGIGLDQFRVYSRTSNMVHSEYGDVAVSTGLVGLAIYMAIFMVFFLRAWKIRRHVPDPVAVRTCGLILAFLVMVLLLDFSRWHFSEKDSWIVFGSLIGYSNAVWQQWKAYQAGAMQVVPAAPAATRLGPVVPGRAV
jgi:O-antigen ligase